MNNLKKLNNKINKLAKHGNTQEAIECCKNLIKENPQDTKLLIKLGDLYLDWHLDIYQSKQYIDDAIVEYQKAAEIMVDDGEIYYKIGTALYYKGEIDKALNYFNMAIDKNADISQCCFMISNCLKRKERFHDALEYIDKALKNSFLATSRLHFSKATLLNSLYFIGFEHKLKSYFEYFMSLLTLPFDKYAIKSVKSKLKWISIIPAYFKAEALLKVYKFDEAFSIYNSLVDKMPGFSILYVALGDAYKKIGKFDEAIVEYKMAIWIDPLNKCAYSGIVQAYEEMGDYDSAIAYYNKYLKIQPNNPVLHSNIAYVYFMKGENELAIKHYQAAISINPRRDWTSNIAQTLGYFYQNVEKNPDCAISNYQIANVLTPKEIDIYISLGSAFYDNEDYKNALIVYRRALELDPKNSRIHCNLGFLYWGLGNLDEAIKEYKLSIEYDKTYDIAHNNLGVIYLDDLVQIQNAIDCFNVAIECNPNYALAYYNLGRCYALKNDNIEAAKYFQQAADINNITNEIDPADINERLNNLFS